MHPQQIAAPEFFDLRFGVAAADQLDGHIEGFAGVVPADDAAAAVEVGRDADMVDADQLDGVVDVVDEVFQVGGRVAGYCLSISASFLSYSARCVGWQLFERSLRPARAGPARGSGRSYFFSGVASAAVRSGESGFVVLTKPSIGDHLDDAAALLEREQLFVVHVAADVAQRARGGVGGDDRRLGQRGGLHHRLSLTRARRRP